MTTVQVDRELLRPFVALLQEHNDQGNDSRPVFAINDALITLGDLRKLRALLDAPEVESVAEKVEDAPGMVNWLKPVPFGAPLYLAAPSAPVQAVPDSVIEQSQDQGGIKWDRVTVLRGAYSMASRWGFRSILSPTTCSSLCFWGRYISRSALVMIT